MGVSLAIVLALLLAGVKYLVMPNVARYSTEIQSRMSAATGMDVSASNIVGGWSGFSPYVELTSVELAEPAGADGNRRVALKLPLVRASLSIPWLAVGQLRLAEVALFGPELSLSRTADGRIYFAGRLLNRKSDVPDDGRFMEWLLNQPGVEIHHARLRWNDAMTSAPELVLEDVGLHVEQSFGRHNIGLVARPPAALAGRVDVRGRFRIVPNEDTAPGAARWHVSGAAYADVAGLNLTELKRHLNVPDRWQAGVGSIRTWVELDSRSANPVRGAVADLHILNARAQLADDVAPLAVSKLAGRLSYQPREDGFSVASTKLEFRTRDGVVLPPADFSVMLTGEPKAANAKGEITANGIDLKVMSALVEYFPIGRDAREFVARFGLRGQVNEARYAWSGPAAKPTSYQIKGRLSDFASNAFEKIPGVTGITGSVDGNEKGGRFVLDNRASSLDMPLFFRDVLRFDRVEGRGKWSAVSPPSGSGSHPAFQIELDSLKLANADLKAVLSGRYTRPIQVGNADIPVEKRPGDIDLTLHLPEADATKVARYFPNAISRTREYLEWALRDGKVEDVAIAIKGPVYEIPFRKVDGKERAGTFTVRAKAKDVDFRYAEGWPVAMQVNGEFTMDGTSLGARVTSGRFYGARISRTNLSIADTYAAPSILSVTAEADARAEDVSRYLRESPLIDGPGAFTRFVALEGPGKLNLDLRIPLGATNAAEDGTRAVRPRINGRYQLTRGSAKLGIGVQINNLSGQVQFSEAGVKTAGPGITGTAFDAPISININGGGEAGVVTEFAGRADVQQLGGALPFAMPPQVTGTTDVAGRLLSKPNGVSLTLDAILVGVASTLPLPLTKRTEDKRALRVQFSNMGQPGEEIQLTLAASNGTEGALVGRFQRRFEGAGDASTSRFQGGVVGINVLANELAAMPIPDGLWLVGKLPQFNFDQWLRAAERFGAPAAGGAGTTAAVSGQASSAPTESGSPITGFDLNMDRLVAYGRSFNGVKLRGRKTTDRAAPVWAMNVASRDAEGDFTWRAAAFNERGAVRARLKRLVLSEDLSAAAVSAQAPEPQATAELPALDVVADEFVFKERWLGKVELRAQPEAENWRIEQLSISNGHAQVDMKGLWQRHGDPYAPPRAGPVKSLTTMDIKLNSSNLNALFGQFGYGDYMKGGRGGLEGRLSWPGHAYQFQTSVLSGQFSVEAERGQFAKVEAGAGKLLGLISLQSIPRRLSFDFRDLFTDGFAFDKIEGDISIADGIMLAKKFDISGPAADVRMAGDVSLPSERQNLTMTVAPKLSGVAAVGAGVLVNPLVGLGVLLGGEVLKSPIERVLSVQYTVTGTWDNPVIERIGRTVAPNATAASNTSVTPPAASAPPPTTDKQPTKKTL